MFVLFANGLELNFCGNRNFLEAVTAVTGAAGAEFWEADILGGWVLQIWGNFDLSIELGKIEAIEKVVHNGRISMNL